MASLELAAAGAGTKGLPFHALPLSDVYAKLACSDEGLAKVEAAERLKRYGPNTMTAGASRTLLHMIWDQLANIITVILAIAAIVSGIFKEWVELGFIAAVILCNVVIGVAQEGKAEAATKAIKAMVTAGAIVTRNGRKQTVEATSLVPGDLIHLAAGDKIPADIRIIDASDLQVTEAVLTGESAPVGKDSQPVAADAPLGDRSCMAFTGTLVFSGQASGIVVATGDDAEVGKINTLMKTVEHVKTPLLVQIESFGFALSVICIIVAVVSWLIAYFARDYGLSGAFGAAISISVAMIPEGLPTVVTICLALATSAMAAQKAVIRQLPAVETLGAVTVICSDKTGTLTKNEMTAVGIHMSAGVMRATGTGYNPDGSLLMRDEPLAGPQRDALRQLLLPAALCNDATLMPLVSAHAQAMLTSQPLMLPQLLDPLAAAQDAPPSPRVAAVLQRQATAEVGATGAGAVPASPITAVLQRRITEEAGADGAAAASTMAALALPGLNASAAGAGTDVLPVPPALKGAVVASTEPVGASIVAAMTATLRQVTWGTTGDPTEAALLALAMKAGLNLRTLNSLWNAAPRIATLPFSSDHKFMATVHELQRPRDPSGRVRRVMLVKGAPDVLLPRCATQAKGMDPWASEPLEPARWAAANAALSREGLRVLALCWRELPDPASPASPGGTASTTTPLRTLDILEGEPSLQLNCLVAIVDPPRDEAITAVKSCHGAGVCVKMITGDHAETAHTIGKWIGIESASGEVLTGPQLEAMSDEQLEAHVEGCNVFARASPEHKLRIVRALQKHGHIVAMTGDGVNDAPALRQANVGVAMGIAGTEVAKEAAKMILLDDNFATLEKAVHEGRRTYDNLRKLIAFILPTSLAQGGAVALAVYAGLPPPLTGIQILYVNMLTACSLGMVLAIEAPEANVMQRPPRRQDKHLVSGTILWRTLFVGGCMIAAMLGQQSWSLALGGTQEVGHTVAMNTLVISQALYCFSCRSFTTSALSLSAVTGNPWLTSMVILNCALQALITYTPGVQSVWETASIGPAEWGRVVMFAVAIFLLVEAEKAFGPRFVRPVVLPYVRRLKKLLGCGRRKGPAPFVLPRDVVAATVNETVNKSSRALGEAEPAGVRVTVH